MPDNELRLPGQERFIAPLESTPLEETGTVDESQPPEGQWKEAWKHLRRNPIFWISAAILAVVAVVVLFPSLFTDLDPTRADLSKSLDGPSDGHIAGYDRQGYDVFARTIYGARASVLVGSITTVIVAVLGIATGAIAGFYGGFTDTIISRFADIFFAVPLLLGAIVVLGVINNAEDFQLGPIEFSFDSRTYWGGIFAVVLAMALFGWPQVTRITRSAVLQVKNMEFIDAAQAIGATRFRNLVRHVIPNSLPPVIVVSTISLGIFIVAEATLSFLGIGLPFGVVSWGNDISAAQNQVRSGQRLGTMFWPAGALAITALGFILLGDAVSDALDPKRRNRE